MHPRVKTAHFGQEFLRSGARWVQRGLWVVTHKKLFPRSFHLVFSILEVNVEGLWGLDPDFPGAGPRESKGHALLFHSVARESLA